LHKLADASKGYASDDWERPKIWEYGKPVIDVKKRPPSATYYDSFNGGARRVTYCAILTVVWDECYERHVVSRTYTAEMVKNYFRLVCLSEGTTKGFLDRCNNIRSLSDCTCVPLRVSPTKRRSLLSSGRYLHWTTSLRHRFT
jgi:hypothetical protein